VPPEPRRVDGWIGFGVLLAAGVALPLLTRDSYHLDVATGILRNLLLTMSLRYVMSTGQLNMAHVSFMGIAAYASALLVTRAGWSFWAALPVAPLLAALAAVPVGRVALRVSGPYYFLTSFAFLEVLRLVFNNFFVDYLGGPSGLVEIPPPHPLPLTGGAVTFIGKLDQYWLMLVLFLASAAVLIRLECSRFGLVNGAIRQGELLAETLGVDVARYKLGAFVLGRSSRGWPASSSRTRSACCTRATSGWSRWCCWSCSPSSGAPAACGGRWSGPSSWPSPRSCCASCTTTRFLSTAWC